MIKLNIIRGFRLFLFTLKQLRLMDTEKKFGDHSLEKHYHCIACGLAHKHVEAGGIWHCPNIACTVSGNHYFRSQLKSYKEEANGKHTVDFHDWEGKVREMLPTITDPDIYAAVENSLFRIRGKIMLIQ